jgi:hypothetical protein
MAVRGKYELAIGICIGSSIVSSQKGGLKSRVSPRPLANCLICRTIARIGWVDVSDVSTASFNTTEALARSGHNLTMFFSDFEV